MGLPPRTGTASLLNYQMDGNWRQDSYSVYLDNLTLTYQ